MFNKLHFKDDVVHNAVFVDDFWFDFFINIVVSPAGWLPPAAPLAGKEQL